MNPLNELETNYRHQELLRNVARRQKWDRPDTTAPLAQKRSVGQSTAKLSTPNGIALANDGKQACAPASAPKAVHLSTNLFATARKRWQQLRHSGVGESNAALGRQAPTESKRKAG